MTNAEKYLKEEQFIFDISKGIAEAICYDDMEHSKNITEKEIRNWFTNNIKPTLTEDERVILRNLRYEKGAYEYTKIGRTELDSEGNCDLILIDSDNESVWWGEYGHLFQFIKERRRIFNRGVAR